MDERLESIRSRPATSQIPSSPSSESAASSACRCRQRSGHAAACPGSRSAVWASTSRMREEREPPGPRGAATRRVASGSIAGGLAEKIEAGRSTVGRSVGEPDVGRLFFQAVEDLGLELADSLFALELLRLASSVGRLGLPGRQRRPASARSRSSARTSDVGECRRAEHEGGGGGRDGGQAGVPAGEPHESADRADPSGLDRLEGQEPGEVFGQVVGRGVAVVGALGQGLEQERLEVERDSRVELPGASGLRGPLICSWISSAAAFLAVEGRPQSDQLIERRPKAVDVGPAVDRTRPGLLGALAGSRSRACCRTGSGWGRPGGGPGRSPRPRPSLKASRPAGSRA